MKNISKQKNKRLADSDSDLANDNDFDTNNSFGDDEIEKFYDEREEKIKNSLKGKGKKSFSYSSDEEEVLAFDDEGDDDEDGEYNEEDEEKSMSDDEEADEDNGVAINDEKDEIKWGTKKSTYYSGNKIENDEDAELEEEEAKLLQEKIMKRLDVDDFGLGAFKINELTEKMKTGQELESKKLEADLFGEDKRDPTGRKRLQKVIKNLDNLSKSEQIEFLKQESPELFELIREFKNMLKELSETLLPIYDYLIREKVPNTMSTKFVYSKTKFYLIYCCQLSFYFALKSQRLPVQNHPVIQNILQYRNLCKVIGPIDDKLKDELELIKKAITNGEKLAFEKKLSIVNGKHAEKTLNNKKRQQEFVFGDNDDEDDEKKKTNGDDVDHEYGDTHKKRAINYEIEKNKGLTPKRNKKYRNPRVKNRIKARKALIKRKSIVRNIRTQNTRYSGEATGIRSNIVRSVKIK